METIRRFFEDPSTSFFLFGPRGTGKSTWIRHLFPDALYVDLLAADEFRALAARPERLEEIVGGHPEARVVVVAEIQKVPELLDAVHRLLEGRRRVRFVLTGSSARKLKRTGVDLLAGRALLRTLHPFMAAELRQAFDLDAALLHGTLPLVVASPRPRETLEAYVSLYLREEVLMEGLVRQVGAFTRFLEAISFSHGQVLNVANVARECEVERKTVAAYIAILEDLLLAFRLPVFARKAKRIATIAHSKFYLFDAGVFRALRPAGPLDRAEELAGAALEGLVAQHLRAWLAYGEEKADLYFWRTRSGVEVDFIIYGPRGFWAVEVKSTARLQSRDLAPLRAFQAEYPACKPMCLYRGRTRLMRDGVLCIPCEEFLANLRPGAEPG